VDISIPKGGKKGSSPQRDYNQNSQNQSILQADEQYGNRENQNQSMNIEVNGNYNQNVNMFYQEPKVNMPATQNANPQMNQTEV